MEGLPARPTTSRAAVVVALAVVAVASLAGGGRAARAAGDRLVVGTSDPVFVSAMSVAVSSRGLTIVELVEPLGGPDEVAARRALAAHEAVAVVWLCDGAAGHALCFCDREGRFVKRPISVASPLAPPDAAALAVSVKILLWGVAPKPAPDPVIVAPPPPPDAAEAPPPRSPAVVELTREPIPPVFAMELAVGARVQAVAAQHAVFRLGARGVYAPGFLERRLAFGANIEAGPSSDDGGARVNDVTLALIARGRQRVGQTWLELGVGPSFHFVSVQGGVVAGGVDVAFDARAGLVVPIGRTFVGVRVGGFHVLTTSPLPGWDGDVALVAGVALW